MFISLLQQTKTFKYMAYDKDYIKSLYILYEETDPTEEDSVYTVDYTVGEHFDDATIDKLCNSDDLTGDISELVTDDIIGELKNLYIRDNTDTVLLDTEE